MSDAPLKTSMRWLLERKKKVQNLNQLYDMWEIYGHPVSLAEARELVAQLNSDQSHKKHKTEYRIVRETRELFGPGIEQC